MRIDNYDIDIPDLLRRWHIDDQRVLGREINAPCPWRKHKSGKYKFYINMDSGLWNCQACPDKGGSLKGLISLMEDVQSWEIGDFVRRYGREVNLEGFDEYIIDLLYPDDEPVRLKSIKNLREQTRRALQVSKPSIHYWKTRGLRSRTTKYWNLRILSALNVHPLIIPITVDGLPYFHARRAIDSSIKPKYLFQPGFPRKEILFGLDKMDPNSSTIVVCEGMFDCIKVWQALREKDMLDEFSPVAILGARASKQQIESIEAFSDVAILFLDNDNAGREGSDYFLRDRKRNNLWMYIVDYEDRNSGDPGDLSSEEIIDMIENAEDVLSMNIRKEIEVG